MDSKPLLSPTDAGPNSTHPLRALPQELIEAVLPYLSQPDLLRFALACRWAYSQAIPYLWRDLELVDCWSIHPKDSRPQLQSLRCDSDGGDEHDDTPIIKKLYVLATNPLVASHVHTVLHRCHLPPPGLFNDLPCMSFLGPNISNDPRTLRLLDLAIWNMKNVNTLRVVFGHDRLTRGLLNGFLKLERPRDTPLKRLWLENCSLVEPFVSEDSIIELESIRIRRLKIRANDIQSSMSIAQLARGGKSLKNFNNGAGSSYSTTTYDNEDPGLQLQQSTEWDDMIYARIPEISNYLPNDLPRRSDYMNGRSDATMVLNFLLHSARSTLVSLNLDWVIWTDDQIRKPADTLITETLLKSLSRLHFPNLRAFQVRNAVTDQTKLPESLYLFGFEAIDTNGPTEPVFLNFLETHPSLKCLAWPMDRFFHHSHRSAVCPEIAARIDIVIANMGRTLIDLRVDADFGGLFEEDDDDLPTLERQKKMARRRLFISEFAAHMTKLESLKMEGSIPGEEHRETIRALHKCALQKVVLIGVVCPIGNSWGPQGEDLFMIPDGFQFQPNSHRLLDNDSDIVLDPSQRLKPPGRDFRFESNYGKGPWPPMLHVIAAYHGGSITELKFCGYAGAPITYTPLPITKAYLTALRYFENLRQFGLSMSLPTYFVHRYCDEEIIAYWLNAREPTSTALAVIPPEGPDMESLADNMDGLRIAGPGQILTGRESPPSFNQQNAWARMLANRYEPRKMAEEVTAQIAPHLSETAKGRPGGVNVRAGFCMGDMNSDVFNLDVKVGAGNRIISYQGPREEAERQLWWDKMNSRRWF
ncbi:hypothetical protein K490DRAFT_35015 [Saccharata proteae CBS 121410]|uniref:F-box domain-containing protein n=1 Tax=Saccharata proteae CBS 121410 TaxID=1314787 RepID=A0A9P4HYH4_9PEZI|nr:hypothetical protein K490DRAFT_35015 [Saccharata proteae CBS 121410]